MENLGTVPSILPILVFVVPVAFAGLIFALGLVHRVFREGLALVGLLVTFAISIIIYGQVLGGAPLVAWGQRIESGL